MTIKLSGKPTPFGQEIMSWMKESEVAPLTVLKILGVRYPDRFERSICCPQSMISLDFIFRLSNLIRRSPVHLLRLLYESQRIADINERDIHFILIFDRFFRLKEKDQNTLLLLCQGLFQQSPSPLEWNELEMEPLETAHEEITLQYVAEQGLFRQGFSHVSLGAHIGVGPFYVKRLFLHTSKSVPLSKSVYLPILLRVASALKISPIRIFLLLYNYHDAKERQRDRQTFLETRYYEFFSRFFCLGSEQRDEIIIMADSLLRQSGARLLSQDQKTFIDDHFRVQPLFVRRKQK